MIILRIKLRLIVFASFILLAVSCSSRQTFEENTDQSSVQSWWRCDPKNAREWRCSDGNTVEETVDLVATAEEIKVLQPQVKKQQTIIESTLPYALDKQQEIVNKDSSTENFKPMLEETQVQIEEKEAIPAEPSGDWVIQLGSFRSEKEALSLSKIVGNANVSRFEDNSTVWYRVILDGFMTRYKANQKAMELKQQNPSLMTWVRKN